MINRRIPPIKIRNALSQVWGEKASAKVIRIGIVINAIINWLMVKEGIKRIITINDVIKTHALPFWDSRN